MKRVYDLCCKTCWYMWVSNEADKICPRCGEGNIDVKVENKLTNRGE